MNDLMITPEKNIPVLSLRNFVLFPGQALPIWISSDQSRRAAEAAISADGWMFVVKSRDSKKPDARENFYSTGVLAKIQKLRRGKEDDYQLLLNSYDRFEVEKFTEADGFWVASGARRRDKDDTSPATQKALEESLRDTAKEILKLVPSDTSRLENAVAAIKESDTLLFTLAHYLDISIEKKIEILSEDSRKNRFLNFLEILVKFKEELTVQQEIGEKISDEMSRRQRDAILREQLKAIQSQLGENEDSDKTEELRKKIEEAGMPDEVKTVALEQFKRLQSLGTSNPESHVVRNYLELLVAIPWKDPELKPIDLEKAKARLDADHFGLNKVKERILEHLAVMKLKNDTRGTILLMVGPPGVGKTSLAKSIAKALDREFVRVSLGGVRDDAEIRGHRRTYVGAMPGRIIEGIKRAKVKNPVFLLDEVDKLSRSFAGDPAGALLEVLDPEQNDKFSDHYLDVPYDLSKVVFIATANQMDTIPGPLLDRMEVIELSGYTNEEKHHIAKEHLVRRAAQEVGLTSENFNLPEEILKELAHSYTREAGVRELQRKISAIARAAAREIAGQEGKIFEIDSEKLRKILGPESFRQEDLDTNPSPGVVTGLAWTPMGGSILYIESSAMPGKGNLQLTGQLGDVMKESSQIAVSLARGRFRESFPNFKFFENDLHVHVPAGAIPKDGPSAGVTMLTSIVSLLSNVPVDPKLAMTGEITLRGAVLPVGGIKEKVIAAHRAGVRKIILSKKNEKDLFEVSEEVQKDLQFIFVSNAQEVIQEALGLDLKAWTQGFEGISVAK